MAYGKRKKGGQRLMDLAKKSRRKKESRVGGKKYVTPLPKPKPKPRPKPRRSKKSTSDVPPAFPARGGRGREAFPQALVSYAKENPVETLLTFLPGGAGLGAKLGGSALKLAKGAKPLVKVPKGKPTATTPTRPSGTPAKPSGRGPASGGKKASGPGSRTTRRNQRQTAQQKRRTQSQKDRTAARKKRETAAERRERLDSGGVRMAIQKHGGALNRGRRTQAQRRAARQNRKRYNL